MEHGAAFFCVFVCLGYQERIEAWIVEQAGIVFDAKAELGKLQLATG